MHARVTTATIQQDKIDECIRIFRDSIVPDIQRQKGFRDLLMLTNRATGKSAFYALWESEADLRANEASGSYQLQVAKLLPMFVGQPTREIYEVTVNELSALRVGSVYGRVTSAIFQQGKIDEGTRILRDSILPEARKQQGFDGLLSMVDRNMGKSYTLSCWESKADMKASESSGFYQAQLAKLHSLFIGQPTHESYEVTVPIAIAPPSAVDTQVHPPTP
ncbi:MAG TPA: hypothetical protein VF510_13190 [Ktedonobacterales bacterium]